MLSDLVRKLSRIPIYEVLGAAYALGSWQHTRDGQARPTSVFPPVNLWPGRMVEWGEGQQCKNV